MAMPPVRSAARILIACDKFKGSLDAQNLSGKVAAATGLPVDQLMSRAAELL